MEFSLSGNALKTISRSITSLARIGNELVIQASTAQLAFHTLNSSRSAYQSITFKPDFFDTYTVSGTEAQCSVLLKAICSVLRTPITNIDHLSMQLPDRDAPKVQWILNCYNGIRKTYWINCNVEPDIQQLALDRSRFPSDLVVRPRDLNRLLTNFQSSLSEITVIATEPTSSSSHGASEIGGKAVELRSYIDPTKENESLLHTQLWIDPAEEFVQYNHTGDPVDVTFSVKELKAFLSFCEGCEVDIHIFFEKAGDPILMAPKFGIDDDGSCSNFDSTLVLATMLVTQIPGAGGHFETPASATANAGDAQTRHERSSANPSDHTRIWSDLSGSGAKNNNGADERHVQGDSNPPPAEQRDIQGIGAMHITKPTSARENEPGNSNFCHRDVTMQNHSDAYQGTRGLTQHYRSNWVDADDEDDDEEDENEAYVDSTPPLN